MSCYALSQLLLRNKQSSIHKIGSTPSGPTAILDRTNNVAIRMSLLASAPGPCATRLGSSRRRSSGVARDRLAAITRRRKPWRVLRVVEASWPDSQPVSQQPMLSNGSRCRPRTGGRHPLAGEPRRGRARDLPVRRLRFAAGALACCCGFDSRFPVSG
jgi:hypothetical protein